MISDFYQMFISTQAAKFSKVFGGMCNHGDMILYDVKVTV